jgi:hypothetical protein
LARAEAELAAAARAVAALYAADAGEVAPELRAAAHRRLREAQRARVAGPTDAEVAPAQAGLRVGRPVLTRAEAAPPTLARLLGVTDLTARVVAARARSAWPARLDEGLVGFTLLVDHAVHDLDYATVGVGMFEGHPECRRRHRQRAYAPAHLAASAPRQAASRRALAAALAAALRAPEPAEALEAALVQAFLREVGMQEDLQGARPDAVLRALEDELFAPLRALREALEGRERLGAAAHARMQAVVAELAAAVVRGGYPAWRARRPAALEALAWLAPGAAAAWAAGGAGAHPGPEGVTLRVHEPEGHALFWATKVGGPSHAFDAMNACVLSLLANPRTRVAAVEDPRWHQTAARAYLRLLPDEAGRPVVYLEPAELDFPYRPVHGVAAHAWILQALLQHARARAAALGAALLVTGPYRGAAEAAGLTVGAAPRLVHLPSPAVVEASDTLRPDHDWVQDVLQTVRPAAWEILG